MSVSYEASVQVPRSAGFWCPHTEYDYSSALCTSLTEAMHWLANNQMAYLEKASAFVDLRINGKVEVSWEFYHSRLILRVPL